MTDPLVPPEGRPSLARPGPLNSLTDVAGLKVGHAQDERVRTGVTVVLPDRPCICAVDVRGGGPGTRETDALAPDALVGVVHGLTFSGGSVYGLAAGDGVTAWLGAQGRGFSLRPMQGVPVAPIVPGAILFDLANGGDKAWAEEPPYRGLGRQAAELATDGPFPLGSVGAGYGAAAGALKGGVGSASVVTADGFTVAALVVVNSFGAVVGPDGKRFFAAPFEIDAEFGGLGPPQEASAPDAWPFAKLDPSPRANTTLAVVATDAALTNGQAKRLATMAQDGLARAIRPVHAPFDGDVVFAIATGGRSETVDPMLLARLGGCAADTVARAVARGVFEATAMWDAGPVAWRDR